MFGFSGGGGNGVAVNKSSGDRTYMKMGTGGIGFGLGGQKYQVIFLFQDEKTFHNFVEKGWKADASAQAAAGTDGAPRKVDAASAPKRCRTSSTFSTSTMLSMKPI